ncbi:MAG: DUF853 family protein, partial [Proteobacteria bacterium]
MKTLFLGSRKRLDGRGAAEAMQLPAHHLVTHGVIVGMTGSGKTGLLMVTLEEALRTKVPVLCFDVKGDLPNLLLAFDSFDSAAVLPWASAVAAPEDPRSDAEVATAIAAERKERLASWGIDETKLAAFRNGTSVRVITPGSGAGEPLHVLSSLERRSSNWHHDPDA